MFRTVQWGIPAAAAVNSAGAGKDVSCAVDGFGEGFGLRVGITPVS